MASNQPHTKRDVGGQGAKDDKSKNGKEDKKPSPPQKAPSKTSRKS